MNYYEQHPVTAERKKELRAKGYRVLDIKFAPIGWSDPEAQQRPIKRRPSAKGGEQ